MMNLNKGVGQLSLGQISNNTQEAVRFVGRDVIAKGSGLMWDEQGISPVRFNLQDEADSVKISIYDENGNLVREASVDGSAGPRQFQWDGTDDEGRQREPGRYTVSIEALDEEGNELPVDSYVRGRVDGVRFDNGYPELLVNGRRLRMSDISEVN